MGTNAGTNINENKNRTSTKDFSEYCKELGITNKGFENPLALQTHSLATKVAEARKDSSSFPKKKELGRSIKY
jgi:hypothetical protein